MDRTHPAPDGTNLTYRLEGSGPARLLFVHGFPFDSRQWSPQLGSLGDAATMAAPDLRGLGGSEGPLDPGAYSMATYAEDLHSLMQDLGWDRAVLAGLSMGGYIAFEFLRRFPDAVEGLVLLDTQPYADSGEARKKRSTHQGLVRSEGVAALADQLLPAVLGKTTMSERPGVVEAVRDMMEQAPSHGVIGALEAIADRPDSLPMLADIDVPVLICVGEEDTITPPAIAASMTAAISGSKLVVIPGAGHVTSLEAPQEVEDAMRSFLSGGGPGHA